MKKTLVIPDVHGTTHWKSCVDKIDEFDYIVQLGDWFDQWHNDWKEVNQIENLREFVEFKKKYNDKVYLLIGNHDLGYLMNEDMSGQQKEKFYDIKDAMKEFFSYMDIATEIDGYVLSHAGFSKTWMKNNNFKTIEDVNKAFHESQFEPFRFCGWNRFGDDVTQGPTWIRPDALIDDMYFEKQIVGHTEVKKPFLLLRKGKYEIVLVDSKDHIKQYVIGDKIDNIEEVAKFKVHDKVEFSFKGEVKRGTIEVVDKYGALECDGPSYDILVPMNDTIYKHVEEKDVRKV